MSTAYIKSSNFLRRLSLLLLLFLGAVPSLHAATLSGKILDKNNQPILGANAVLFQVVNGSLIQTGELIQVSSNGEYTWTIEDGDYVLRAYFNFGDVSLLSAPNIALVQTEDFPVIGDVIRDSVFDFELVSGIVTDSNKIVIEQVDVSTTLTWNGPEIGAQGKLSQHSITHANRSSNTDENGHYNLLLFSSNECIESGYYVNDDDCSYDITYSPIDTSGFADEIESDYFVSANQSLNAVLGFSDHTPATVIIGPYLKNVTDHSAVVEWLTDEATTASVKVVGGELVNDNQLTTFHSVVLNELTPSSNYSALVDVADKQGNQTTRITINFDTTDSPDLSPPKFVQALTATKVASNSFSISFCANEPVNGVIRVENTDYLLSGYSNCHELSVDALDSNQSYVVRAAITDIAGNGAIESAALQISTLPAPDLLPPAIINGPFIVDVKDTSAIVLWTTNEPATSDVTYNDSVVYRVSGDPNLVTQHSVKLTGLTPNTTYDLGTSSKDAAGNGPVLSSTISFSTSTSPDSSSPIILGRPLIEDITGTSAVIRWQTDESSSSFIAYGSDSNNLFSIETSREFSTSHSVILTNLDPSTNYYFTAKSIDLAGNEASSSLFSFSTRENFLTNTLEIISGPIVENISGSSLTLSWKTNINADTRLVCESANGVKEVNKIALVKNHIVSVAGLDVNTGYRCVVYSTDVSGFIASKVIGVVSTGDTDIVAPQCLTPPLAQGFVTFAELTWSSDELATAVIQYRQKGETNWSQVTHDRLTQAGFKLITGLEDNTDYQHQIILTDSDGNSGSCAQGEFNSGTDNTLPVPVFSTLPFASDITANSAVINWQTSALTSGQVRFGLTNGQLNGIESDSNLAVVHQIVLNNLQPDTTYLFEVDAFNSMGAVTTSTTISFTTLMKAPNEIVPPQIIIAPVVKNITDTSAVIEWETDKLANSEVVINGGATFKNTEFSSKHSVLLTGLSPNTNYSTFVTSTDEYSNSSAAVAVNFRTMNQPDQQLPSFIIGPLVYAIDYNQFIVYFCADEPVTGSILVGSSDHNLNGGGICHQSIISGLTSNTEYEIVVSITDIAANGPVFSTPVFAKTLLEIDIEAPTISGPIVTNVTDSSAIVSWTTNEVSTSGVFYTDGSTANQIEDIGLVKEHQIFLSNLSANTTYELFAFSTDGLGNGPAVSSQLNFTTLGIPDTKTPQLLISPYVEDITANSAMVLWATDEPATHVVRVGVTENELNVIFSLDGMASEHAVPLTGLAADTLYYFQVESSDLSGNVLVSQILTFSTLTEAEVPISLQIIDGPNVDEATANSISISWLTNLNSTSRLVCETEIGSMGQLQETVFFSNDLATFNSVDSKRAIKDQYIALLKNAAINTLAKSWSGDKRKAVDFVANDIAQKVKGKIIRKYSNSLNGFTIKMSKLELLNLRKDKRISMVEQDQVVSISAVQNGATWGLDRIDQINLPLDTNYNYELNGTGVNAYVIDTGVLNSHADFGGRSVSGWDFVDNDSDATDCNGHGTHVAGTIGSTTWGVAKNVKITGIRVLGCNGSGTNSGVIAGVDWVAENAVFPAVANMSLGGGNSTMLDTAVNNAINSGITFVVAAGNANINACSGSPNRVPAAITVAASTSSDFRSGFSNWGSCVDIFAPGSDITSTWSNGGENTISGTSMAAPHVAGAIALYLQAHPNSSPSQVDAGITGFAGQGKISSTNGSPNLLLNVEFDSGTIIKPPPPPPPAETIKFETGDESLTKFHRLTLTGLQASTTYQCKVFSTDIDATTVSATFNASTSNVPDITPPICSSTPIVNAFEDTAFISWKTSELTTAQVDYRVIGAEIWQQQGSLSLEKEGSLLLNNLLSETTYEHQVTVTDQAGNVGLCPAGSFTTLAAEEIQQAVFTIQPFVTNIEEHVATVNWETLEASFGQVKYGKSPANLDQRQTDNNLHQSHAVNLVDLEAGTTYYLQVEASNILGVITNSEIVSFNTLHPNNDFDGDGIPNDIDNCRLTPNPDQQDSDSDGIGDVCEQADLPDNDFDNDGILNDVDNCPIIANPDQADIDGNGIGDVCDAPIDQGNDFDGDDVLDDVDNCPSIANPDQLDSDSNGIGNACDVPDVVEPPPSEPIGINLRGEINAEGTVIAGAIVAIYNAQQQFIDSQNTSIDGLYRFEAIAAGEYYIGVTPPTGTGFSAPPIQAISIADRDVVRNITLIGNALQLSGTLQDSLGRPIDNVKISLHLQSTNNQVGNSLLTDNNGTFQFLAAPGIYKIKVVMDAFNGNQNGVQVTPNYPVPDFAAIFHARQNIQLVSDSELDISLPFALLSGRTLDSLGNPVAGVGLTIDHQFSSIENNYYLSNYATDIQSNSISDAFGNFQFAIFTDQEIDIRLTPPENRIDLATTTVSGYSLSVDRSEDFILVEGQSLSGTLQDSAGRAIDRTKITLHSQETGDQIGRAVFSDASGLFQFQVANGTYKIQPHLNPFGLGEGNRTSYPLPDFASMLYGQENIAVSGTTVQDIVIPIAILNGTVIDTSGNAIADTRVNISHIENKNNAGVVTGYFLESQGRSAVSNGKTDSNGQFSLAIFTDQSMDITFEPPVNDRINGATLVADYSISQDTTDTFVLQQSYRLSGYLRDQQGNLIDNTLITVHHNNDNNLNNSQLADAPTVTDENGYFEFKVAAGDYKIRPYLQQRNSINGAIILTQYPVPDFAAIYYLAKNIKVNSDTQLDLVMPMSILNGKTLDANGVVVPNVKLKIDHALAESSTSYYLENNGDLSDSNAVSDLNGLFEFGLFTNQIINVSINPPADSGFAITNVAHSVSQETSEDIFLIHKDFPPKIISGPVITNIGKHSAVVVWRTDKPANGIIELSNGRVINVDNLDIYNRVLIKDLERITEYSLTLQAVDKDNQVSQLKQTSFVTKGAPGNALPEFVSGPTVSNIGNTQFEVSFCADGPVSSTFVISESEINVAEIALCHRLEIDALIPNTGYTVIVEITDPFGNGPTISHPINITTLPLADIAPPTILLTPFVVDISANQATVIWQTDEPASSGISYNDGHQYHVVTDDEFVNKHSMQLTDLSPNTQYTLTVSSTDSYANGPTLSEPITFTTLSNVDVTPPAIIGSALIQNITHQSVVFRWSTDEPASSQVVIGTTPDTMNRVENTGSQFTRKHNIALTGLERETVYYAQVQSNDAAGNLVLGEIVTFITKRKGSQGVPHFMKNVSVDEQSGLSISVSWVTDVNADGRLVCVEEASNEVLEVSHTRRVKNHHLTLNRLRQNSRYSCTVFTTDHASFTATQIIESIIQTGSAKGQESSSQNAHSDLKIAQFFASLSGINNGQQSKTDVQQKVVPSLIAEPQISGFGNLATVQLVSNQLTAVQIQYREEGNSRWNQVAEVEALNTHFIVLNNLSENTNYEMQYSLVNLSGEKTPSDTVNFNSGASANLSTPQFLSQPLAGDISENTATLTWETQDYAYAQVSYGTSPDSLLEKESHAFAERTHQVTLVRLDTATSYYAEVTVYNLAGERVVSDTVIFTTSAVNNIIDSDGDGIPDYWEIEYLLDARDPVDAIDDLDNDGLSNREEFANSTDPNNGDSDGDGMPDGWEVDHGLDPNNASDASADANGNGVSNLDEYTNASDKEAPVISLPGEISIDATGILTKIPSVNVSALDNIDGTIAVSLIGSTHLKSGLHLVDWMAEDNAGNKTVRTQIIKINPLAVLAASQIVAEGNGIRIKVSLSGEAAVYPVQVPYSFSGTADSADFYSEQNVITIYEGDIGYIHLDILEDNQVENDEQLILSLASPTNAALGNSFQQMINISSVNVAPSVFMSAVQNGQITTHVNWSDGPVVVSVNFSDLNTNDTLSVDWIENDNATIGVDSVTHDLTFDPLNVALGSYRKSVSVVDDGEPSLSTNREIEFRVTETSPVLSVLLDSDNDGINDAEEGNGDLDLDGIPNYLDNSDAENILPLQLGELSNNDGSYLMQAEWGVKLGLGSIALAGSQSAQQLGALIDQDAFENSILYDQVGSDSLFTNIGGLVDFKLSQLPQVGASVLVVIPQQQAIPADAVYRKVSGVDGWTTFTENSSNQLYSAGGEAGICPTVGDSSYSAGLTAGHWCVMLLIEDGGANDADAVANGIILDPGGVSQGNASAVVSITPLDSVIEGGAINLSATVVTNGNDIVSTLWEQTGGPTVSIANSTSLNASVSNAPVGTLTFQFSITDGIGRVVSNSVSVVVTAVPPVQASTTSSSDGGGSLNYILLLFCLILIFVKRKYPIPITPQDAGFSKSIRH